MRIAIHQINFCPDCGKEITSRAKKCISCCKKGQTNPMHFIKKVEYKVFRCIKCKIEKPVSDFPKYKKGRGFQGVCKQCKAQWMREDRIKNPERYWILDIKKYGITKEYYYKLLKKQNEVCAICGKPEKTKKGLLHIDHCHLTGKVRGLLCANCNTGIGKFYEQIKYLESAIQYLKGGGLV